MDCKRLKKTIDIDLFHANKAYICYLTKLLTNPFTFNNPTPHCWTRHSHFLLYVLMLRGCIPWSGLFRVLQQIKISLKLTQNVTEKICEKEKDKRYQKKKVCFKVAYAEGQSEGD